MLAVFSQLFLIPQILRGKFGHLNRVGYHHFLDHHDVDIPREIVLFHDLIHLVQHFNFVRVENELYNLADAVFFGVENETLTALGYLDYFGEFHLFEEFVEHSLELLLLFVLFLLDVLVLVFFVDCELRVLVVFQLFFLFFPSYDAFL